MPNLETGDSRFEGGRGKRKIGCYFNNTLNLHYFLIYGREASFAVVTCLLAKIQRQAGSLSLARFKSETGERICISSLKLCNYLKILNKKLLKNPLVDVGRRISLYSQRESCKIVGLRLRRSGHFISEMQNIERALIRPVPLSMPHSILHP
jgi:hypothetical protein